MGSINDNGWVRLDRAVLGHAIWKLQPAVLKVFTYCLLRAGWREERWYDGSSEIAVRRGSFIETVLAIAEACQLGRQQVRTALQHLESLDVIEVNHTNAPWPTTRAEHITVRNYDTYNPEFSDDNHRLTTQITTDQPQTFQNKAIETDKSPEINDGGMLGMRPHKEEQIEQENITPPTPSLRRQVAADLGQVSQRFEDFWAAYPQKTGMNETCHWWCSLVTAQDEAQVFACLGRYLQSAVVARGYIKQPAKWLQECARDRWMCEWPKPAAQQPQIQTETRRQRLERALGIQ
jgi:hypothetical protein